MIFVQGDVSLAKTRESQRKAIAKYKKTKDEIRITVEKGRKAELMAHAYERGESLNGFVNRAIAETEERDKTNP
jgi:predicted HicB family RNase H-like nuclease